MRITLLSAGTLLAISLVLNGVARADDAIRLVSNYDHAEAQAAPDSIAAGYAAEMTTSETEAAPACGGCGTCELCTSGNECEDCSGGLRSRIARVFKRSCDLPDAMPCPHPVGGYGFTGVDSFRGLTNGDYPGNNGVVNGLSLGGQLIEDYGIGWQAGMSYGLYDLNGNTTGTPSQRTQATQQVFITTGLFRRADADHRFSWGVVHDWNILTNFGSNNNSPTLTQFRGQAAWAMSAWNQVGVWATIEDRYVTRASGSFGTGPLAYQAIDQANLFWDHQYGAFGATSRFSFGVPLNNRLAGPGASADGVVYGGGSNPVGAFIMSTNWNAPVTNRMSLYANAMYMKPNASPGATAGFQEFWNVSMGFQFSPGGNLRSKTIAGRTWMPYLPVANNSNFLVDTSATN